MFSWLYNALGSMLAWFSSWTGSYAIALLLYALVFKIVFLPFAIKQQKNQIAMAKLTPKIELIRAKYRGRNDRVSMQKMQTEIMELQQKEGYSALSGCLPMLIQLPLIIFLYNVIRNPLSYIAKFSNEVVINAHKLVNKLETAAEFGSIDQIALISKIKEFAEVEGLGALEEVGIVASKIPNFNLWGVNLAATPSLANISILVLIPVLAAFFQWGTMWITRKVNGNPTAAVSTPDAQTQMSMKIMDLVFPLMTLWMAFSFSGMLGLYWIYQSIIAVVQTVIIAKLMPMPKYTEEEIKAMRKAQKEQEKAQRAAMKAQPKYKSLHYIDEDDYDELPEVKSSTQNKPKSDAGSMPEIKD